MSQAGGIGDKSDTIIDVYDHEILQIEKVMAQIKKKQHRRVNADVFRQEVIGRFEEIGFVVDVMTYIDTEEDGTLGFEIVVRDRCDPKPFDHDKQAEEVVSNLLGLDDI